MKEENLKSLFTIAGLPILRHWELPNQYWPRPKLEKGREHEFIRYHALREEFPWWLVRTPFGMIQIGWRKKVIEINWHDTGLAAIDLTTDDVTKFDYLVHAWSELDAVKYLTALRVRLTQREAQLGADAARALQL